MEKNDNVKEILSDITPNKSNVDKDVSYLRDVYLDAEKEYITELLKDEEIRNLIYKVNIDFENPEELFSVAQDLVYKVEMGLVPDDEMETTEQIITVLLAAIQDKVIIKKLVKLPSQEEKQKLI